MRKTLAISLSFVLLAASGLAAAWALLPSDRLPFGRDPKQPVATRVVYHHKRVKVVHVIHKKAPPGPAPVQTSGGYAPAVGSAGSSTGTPSVRQSASSQPQKSTSQSSGGGRYEEDEEDESEEQEDNEREEREDEDE